MDYNIMILLVGCLIVIVTLILVLKDGTKGEDDLTAQVMAGLGNHNRYNPKDAANQQQILDGLDGLYQEIETMKEQLARLSHLDDGDSLGDELSPSSKHEWENFEHSLNYNLFAKKNSEIINLHQKGVAREEIAKSLNKSVREVEMVIKLIK